MRIIPTPLPKKYKRKSGGGYNRPAKYKGGMVMRPLIGWPYSRYSHISFMDDLWFWGQIPDHCSIFRSIRREHPRRHFFTSTPVRSFFGHDIGRANVKVRVPRDIEMIRYRAAMNRK